MGTLTPRALELLRLAHLRPGLTRARAGALLGVTSGTVTELVALLVAARLLDERPAPPTGRGRPTRELVAHPDGPLVLAGLVTHESWRLAVTEIGGTVTATVEGRHDVDDGRALVDLLRAATSDLRDRYAGRVRGLGLALPGVVRDNRLVHAPLLGWRDLDLAPIWPSAPADSSPPTRPSAAADGGPPTRPSIPPDSSLPTRPSAAADSSLLIAGNDATLAALGEARRGAAVDAGLHLHLHLDAGIGGGVTLDGAVLAGARGLGGEFGHMPLGDPDIPCPCGARGCWTMSVGADALARHLGEPPPHDALTFLARALDRAAEGDPDAARATAAMAVSLGRGIAGLVNGLDAALVTIGGLAPRLAAIAAADFEAAYTDGLMAFLRAGRPPIRPAALGDEAPQTGAAEQVWSHLWSRL